MFKLSLLRQLGLPVLLSRVDPERNLGQILATCKELPAEVDH